MATTETRSGFRLPWGADQRTEGGDAKSADAAEGAAPDHAPDAEASAAETAAWPSDDPTPTAAAATGETSTESEGTANHATEPGTDHPTMETTQDAMLDMNAASTPSTASTASTAKRPTKFLADLTKAMRVAAEAEREEIVGRFAADAKAFTELIQERSGTEATELRKRADDDVAAVRDWSKAEIARVREETDERIAHRRTKLDREVEGHAARIEQEIERVKGVVDSFEKEMALFFEELVSEEDPSRFASLAGHLPEPPSLDDAIAALADIDHDELGEELTHVVATEEPTAESETPTPTSAAIEAQADPVADGETVATAEAIAATETTTDQAADAGDVATVEDAVAEPDAEDPRVAALGLTPDFAAAEAEALADVDTDDGSTDGDGSSEAIPALDDETIAARLAGLVPPTDDAAAETASTRLIVTGLVSVASIAGFKRHLARLAGVRSVGVSSGPDGEFVFAVNHDAAVDLREVVPTMPGFGARVTGSEDGTLTVSATDPESDA